MLAIANAKINLGLYVTEKRTDGYHNLETVFYPVKIADVVEITDANEVSCEVIGMEIPGNNLDNICMKAYKLLQQDYEIPPQKITILKNIPVGAGLGGGSSDAAFLIKLLNSKFELKLTQAMMENYARQLGADCPFFIENKPVFAFGIGDEFEPLEIDLSTYFMVLVKPTVHVSTADAYAGIIASSANIVLKDFIHLPVEAWRGQLKNDFEQSVFAKYPDIATIKESLYQAGAIFALMSGSGSSVFAIFKQKISLPDLEVDNKVFYNV